MALAPLGRTPVVEVAGELDLISGDELEALVSSWLAPGTEVGIVLRDVTFADSSGLGALLALLKQAEERGASITLLEPSPAVRRVLTITGTGDLFRVVDRAS